MHAAPRNSTSGSKKTGYSRNANATRLSPWDPRLSVPTSRWVWRVLPVSEKTKNPDATDYRIPGFPVRAVARRQGSHSSIQYLPDNCDNRLSVMQSIGYGADRIPCTGNYACPPPNTVRNDSAPFLHSRSPPILSASPRRASRRLRRWNMVLRSASTNENPA